MICITFDTDYMINSWMELFLEKFSFNGSGTFFSHKYFDCINEKKHEIGLHVFINNLSNLESDIKLLKKEFPYEISGIRNHSCVDSHMIGILYSKLGYRYISHTGMLFKDNIIPYRRPWGIWEIPIYYMDNMDFWMTENWGEEIHKPFNYSLIETAINSDSLFVFDFHPLHIILNTSKPTQYSLVKDKILNSDVSPFDLKFNGYGTQSFFLDLCKVMREKDIKSYTCSEALEYFIKNELIGN